MNRKTTSTLERKVFKNGVKPSRRIKQALVGGVSIAATAAMLGMSGQAMAEAEIGGATGNALTISGATDTIVSKVDNPSAGGTGTADFTADIGKLDLNGGKTVADINNIAHDATLNLYDSTTTSVTGERLTVTNNIDISDGKTLTLNFATDGATINYSNIILDVKGYIAGAADTTKGGNIKLSGASTGNAVYVGVAEVTGKVNMTQVEIIGAGGNVAKPGGHVMATFKFVDTNATGDFKADNLKITGGDASTTAGGAGGAATTTILGDAVIANNIELKGGDAHVAGGAGGAVKLTVEGDLSFTALSFDVGTTATTSLGGTTTLEIVSDNDQTITGTLDGKAVAENGILTIHTKSANTLKTATFKGKVGSTNSLKKIDIGTTVLGGAAIFEETVAAGNITLQAGDNAAEKAAATFNKNVTASTRLDIKGGSAADAAATAIMMGNVNAADLVLTDGTGGASVEFSGTALDVGNTYSQTITGIIAAATDGQGSIAVKNTAGTVKFADAIGIAAVRLKAITLDANSKTIFDAAIHANSLTIGGTGTFKATKNLGGTTPSTLDLSTGSKIIIPEAAKSTTADATKAVFGNSAAAGAITVKTPATAESVTVYVDSTNVVTGDKIVLVKSSATIATATDGTGFNAAALEFDGNDTGQVFSVDNTNTDDSMIVLVATDKSSNNQENLDTAVTDVSQHIVQSIGSTISSRMNFTRFEGFRGNGSGSMGYDKGISPGDNAGMERGVWVKTLGNWIEQDDKGGISGYDADIYGVVVGMDAELTRDIRAGVAFGYSNADVDGSGAARADVDQHHVFVYGDYTGGRFYLEGMLGYGRGNNETSDLDGTTLRKADYGADQYMASVGGGVPLHMGDGVFVTPKASLTWTHIETDSYIRSDGVDVEPSDVDSLTGAIGAEMHHGMKQEKG
uniref:Outer membrane autotransporter barrel domain-containing protein n=1 Tax=Candidatus Kentrum sp. LFY TaxID=2126342 RepID=A0A450UL03_9GAMM|nr:MAG: outer membrane autotransporter barrel domain-containing protein [Candidatus Kentron sp. LFY]